MDFDGGNVTRRGLAHAANAFARPAVAALAAALSVMLGGCFLSEQAKFPLSGGAAAFGEGGRYDVFEHVDGDTYKRQETFVLTHRPDGAYDFLNEKGETLTMLLYPVAAGLFVGQSASTEADKSGFTYVVLRITGNEAVLYVPQCDDQDKDKLAAAKVEVHERFECYIDKVTDPAALFAAVKLGDPVSKLVRQ
jgi:hypothetical protein